MPRKLLKGNSLADVNPQLAEKWHPTKNGDLSPFDVTTGSNKKVWWKCKKGDDHEWEASIKNRSKGQGCSVCRGFTIVPSNSFAKLNPELARDWHPTKNSNKTPFNVGIGSVKEVWWKCDKGENHEWKAVIRERVSGGKKCPFCPKPVRKPKIGESLAEKRPELAKQWHPTKNGDLTPHDFPLFPKSREIIWWKCNKSDDHEWQTSINNRAVNSICPFCSGKRAFSSNSLATLNPELAKQWHPKKNGGLRPDNVTEYSNKEVWWKCDKEEDHEWKVEISNRSNGTGCPFCTGRKASSSNSLATLNPELAKQWHPKKNEDLTPNDVTVSSNIIVWWKCKKGDDHEWEASINNRSKGQGCSVCRGFTIVSSNSLAALQPELSQEWHPIKNGDLTPHHFSEHSGKKVWWQCSQCNLEWKADIGNRSKGVGCPNCAEHGFNPDKLAFFYIRDLKVKNKRAIKFGITNQLTGKRETKQKRGLDGSLETIFKIKTKGIIALEIENRCKNIYSRDGYLSKDELPDGFTETIKYSEENLNKIKSIVDEVLTEKAEKKK
tara:strand:+ start:249 stop:1898 length:1650 start_codon:yes stop_codon:yes gene_type:complete